MYFWSDGKLSQFLAGIIVTWSGLDKAILSVELFGFLIFCQEPSTVPSSWAVLRQHLLAVTIRMMLADEQRTQRSHILTGPSYKSGISSLKR